MLLSVKTLFHDRDPRGLILGLVALIVGGVGAIAGVGALGLMAGVLALTLGLLVPKEQPSARTATAPATPSMGASTPAEAPADTTIVITADRRTPAPAEAVSAPVAPEPALGPGMYVPAHAPASLVDPETGLYTQEYFQVAIETRVLAARRNLRPVAIVLFSVVEGALLGTPEHSEPAAIAEAIRRTLREADTACRLHDGRFAFVLEDTPEDGAIWTVERVRRALAPLGGDQTRWAGIACYPAHAFNATDTLAKAEEAYARACEWAQDRIEVAVGD
ncbi:MAG: diguanylate cyclase [Acidimicrobiia bacterium]